MRDSELLDKPVTVPWRKENQIAPDAPGMNCHGNQGSAQDDCLRPKGGAGPRQGRAGKQRNGTVIYTPNPGFSGQDTFRYRVKDNRGALSNRARVQVTVLSGGRPPVANSDTAATAIDTPVVINVVANDTDADGSLDPRSVAIAANPASGGLVNQFNGTVTYMPSAGFFGTDAFTYTVRDGQAALIRAFASPSPAPSEQRSRGEGLVAEVL